MGNNILPNTFSQKQLNKLYSKFSQMDNDNSGDLDLKQIQNLPELGHNPLVKRVISIFDRNKDGKISFSQFIGGLAILYSDDDQQKIKFAFKIYDIDDDGFINQNQLMEVMTMMVGQTVKSQQLLQLVQRTICQADQDNDGKISYEQFKALLKNVNIANSLKINKI